MNYCYTEYPEIMESVGFNGFSDKIETVYTEHTVLKNDSLWNIAKKYLGSGIRYPEIKKLNQLESDTIYAGQILKIPV